MLKLTEDQFLEIMDMTIREIAAQPHDLPGQPPGTVEASRKFLAAREAREAAAEKEGNEQK
jgi:hypothetical protein